MNSVLNTLKACVKQLGRDMDAQEEEIRELRNTIAIRDRQIKELVRLLDMQK